MSSFLIFFLLPFPLDFSNDFFSCSFLGEALSPPRLRPPIFTHPNLFFPPPKWDKSALAVSLVGDHPRSFPPPTFSFWKSPASIFAVSNRRFDFSAHFFRFSSFFSFLGLPLWLYKDLGNIGNFVADLPESPPSPITRGIPSFVLLNLKTLIWSAIPLFFSAAPPFHSLGALLPRPR